MVATRCGCVAVHLECVAVRLSSLWKCSALFCSPKFQREDRPVWPIVATGECPTSGAERYHCSNPSFGGVPSNLENDRNPYRPSAASAAETTATPGSRRSMRIERFFECRVASRAGVRGSRRVRLVEASGSFSQTCSGSFRTEHSVSISIFRIVTCGFVAGAPARETATAIAAESRDRFLRTCEICCALGQEPMQTR
jgi:hypothetical protein